MASPKPSEESQRQRHRVLPSQRRAGRACLSCRAKKVKCDVLQHGTPCKNCTANDLECLTVRCRRGKKPRIKTKNGPLSLWNEGSVEKFFEPGETLTGTESNVQLHQPECPTLHSTFNLHNDAASLLDPLLSLGDIPTGLERIRSSAAAAAAAAARSPIPEDAAPEPLPPGFKPFPHHWSALDLEYLRRKGAFSIPKAGLRLEIIRCYIENFHPYMPLLDLEDLLQISDFSISRSSRGQYSFLLFQCVMFAGISFVDEQLVQDSERRSVKATRRIFYQRARLLYDADIETDNLTLIQCLLLMSQWAENVEFGKQNWHWTGVAVSLAQATRLTHNPDNLKFPQRVKSLRKRLWFCVFMRDRLLSLGMGRPMRIRDGEFDVQLPTVNDFECDIPIFRSPAAHCDGRIQISLTDGATSNKLAMMFISYIRLCMSIGSIFSVQYTTFTKTSEAPTEASNSSSANIILYPISNQSSDCTFIQMRDSNFSLLEKSLTEWLGSLPHFARHSEIFSNQVSNCVAQDQIRSGNLNTPDFCVKPNTLREPSSVTVYAAIMHMTYHAASSALHRPKNRSSASAQKVSEAADSMAKICLFLNKNGLTQYLPVTTITMLLPSIIWYILSLKRVYVSGAGARHGTAEQTEIHRAKDNLSELLLSLRIQQKAHVGADVVAMLLQAFLVHTRTRVVSSSSIAGPEPRRAFELELNYDQTLSTERLNGRPTTVADGPLTPQSQDFENQPAVVFDEATEIPKSDDNDLRPDLFFNLSYGADLDSDMAGDDMVSNIFGFPDLESYAATDLWGMNSSPNMPLWEEGTASCNDLELNLDPLV